MRRVLISTGKILAFFALWAACVAGAIWIAIQLYGAKFDATVEGRAGSEALLLLAVAIPLLIMALGVDRRPISTLGFPARGAFSGLVFGTVAGIAIFAASVGILMAMGYAHYAPDFSQFDPAILSWLLVATLLNCADQELLVRSYLFQEIWAKYSGAAAIVVSTIVFVGLHAGAIMQGTNGIIAGCDVALASIMLGLAYLRSGALWLPIGLHFGWNAFQVPVLGISVTGTDLGHQWHAFAFDGPALWTGGTMGVEGGLAGLAGPLLGILIVLALPRRPNALRGTAQSPAEPA